MSQLQEQPGKWKGKEEVRRKRGEKEGEEEKGGREVGVREEAKEGRNERAG